MPGRGPSAVYCYYDPTERAPPLGRFNILSLPATIRERELPPSTSVDSRKLQLGLRRLLAFDDDEPAGYSAGAGG